MSSAPLARLRALSACPTSAAAGAELFTLKASCRPEYEYHALTKDQIAEHVAELKDQGSPPTSRDHTSLPELPPSLPPPTTPSDTPPRPIRSYTVLQRCARPEAIAAAHAAAIDLYRTEGVGSVACVSLCVRIVVRSALSTATV